MKKEKNIPMIVIHNIGDWRKWLYKNHLKENKVGMINYKKHTGKKSINHHEALIEAIRFGWIDTTINKLDDKRFVRYFMKRGDNANWSKNTLRYAAELVDKGLMSSHGLLKYKQGMKKNPHDYNLPDNPNMPKDLAQKLNKEGLKKVFDAYAPSYKRTMFRWILRAKLPETRKRRIKIIVKATKEKGKIFPAV